MSVPRTGFCVSTNSPLGVRRVRRHSLLSSVRVAHHQDRWLSGEFAPSAESAPAGREVALRLLSIMASASAAPALSRIAKKGDPPIQLDGLTIALATFSPATFSSRRCLRMWIRGRHSPALG